MTADVQMLQAKIDSLSGELSELRSTVFEMLGTVDADRSDSYVPAQLPVIGGGGTDTTLRGANDGPRASGDIVLKSASDSAVVFDVDVRGSESEDDEVRVGVYYL